MKRHRVAWLFLERKTSLFDGASGNLLHFAPERGLREILTRQTQLRIVGVDLAMDDVDVRVDITRLPFADASFRFVLCHHVLEHIPDDAAAMRELFRVLAPGGEAVLMVPRQAGPTDEDPDAGVEERLRRFRQEDHVRFYGDDFPARLLSAGFDVSEFICADFADATEIDRYVLRASEIVTLARKPN